jgi:hypothetical protein
MLRPSVIGCYDLIRFLVEFPGGLNGRLFLHDNVPARQWSSRITLI